MTHDEIEALTFQHMPKSFFKAILKGTFQAHAVARRDCRSAFAETEAENVQGYYRRGKLEGYLRDAAARFPTLSTTVSKADNSNWNHTEVHGGPVILTENSVQAPCALVEKAEFRLTLARSSQLTLWEEEPRSGDAPLFVLLLHSRSRWATPDETQRWGHLPGSAYLAFPSPDLDSYVHSINLFEMFPAVVQEHVPSDWDSEAQVRYLQRAMKTQAS